MSEKSSSIQLREYARRIINATTIDAKLATPTSQITDAYRGSRTRLTAPGRPAQLVITPAKQAPKIPKIDGFADIKQRVRILHGSANHELQAVELFAWAVLAFPGAPRGLRQGLLARIREEQLHCKLYIDRLSALDTAFGAYPVTGYFWGKLKDVHTISSFLAIMCLTFEQANLDMSLSYERAALACGDRESAAVFRKVYEDEIEHVRFGWYWIDQLKTQDTLTWAYYKELLPDSVPADRCRAADFNPTGRQSAGLSADYIAQAQTSNLAVQQRQRSNEDAPSNDFFDVVKQHVKDRDLA